MNGILDLLWEAAVQSSVLFAAIWVMRLALKGRVSPRVQYALWGLMLLRLLLPLGIESPLSVMNAVEPATEAVRRFVQPQITGNPAVMPQTGAAPSAAPGLPLVLAALWLAGMAVTAISMAVVNLRFRRQAMRGAKPFRLTREHTRAMRICGVRRDIPLYITGGIPSPCLMGLMRPIVLLTPESAALPGRLHHILLHELCHYKQRDNWIALLRNIACIIHWYNPLVWAAARLSRQDCELACDAAVLRRLDHDEHLTYGETLVKLIRSRAGGNLLQTATTMAAGTREMKERLHMIVRQPRTVAVAAAVTLLAAMALAAVACTGAVNGGGGAAPTGIPAATMSAGSGQALPMPTPTGGTQPPATLPLETNMPSLSPTGETSTESPASATDGAEGTLLWEQDGWAYWLKPRDGEEITTKDGKTSSFGSRLGRLYRTKGGEQEVLDEYAALDGRSGTWCVLPADDRIVFIGFTGESRVELKGSARIISIRHDGSDRKTFAPKLNTAINLCYDNGYLYYEGWTNGGAFPRPINRLNTDLTNDYKMADIDGAFITAHGGYAYYLHSKGNRIYRQRLDWKSKPEAYKSCEIGIPFTVRQTGETEFILTDGNSQNIHTLLIQ